MILLATILFAWLAIMGMTVVLCRAAARGDATRAQLARADRAGRRLAPGLVVWDSGACVGARSRRAVRPMRISRRHEAPAN